MCERECVCVCVRARACVCVRACVRVCACVRVLRVRSMVGGGGSAGGSACVLRVRSMVGRGAAVTSMCVSVRVCVCVRARPRACVCDLCADVCAVSLNDYGTDIEYLCALEEKIRPAASLADTVTVAVVAVLPELTTFPTPLQSASLCFFFLFLFLSSLPQKTAAPAFQIPSKTVR